jgi:hypothetical protein
MNNWQPIETAPKDGTPILLKGVSTIPAIGRFFGRRKHPSGERYYMDIPEGWFHVWHGNRLEYELKYWQPLPDPPEE